MINYEWRAELTDAERDELTQLLTRAAHYDAEPEYTTIDINDVLSSMTDPGTRAKHLLIWMLPHATALSGPDDPERIAGILRVVGDGDGTAQASIVIDPRLRSIGITTLLLERIGLDCSPADGWSGTGAHTISAWAQGNHPAAGRISNRFLIPRTRRVWKLIRPAESVHSATAAPVLEPASATMLRELSWARDTTIDDTFALREDGRVLGVITLSFDTVISEEFGVCAAITHYAVAPTISMHGRRCLLDGAAAIVHEKGRPAVVIYVDSNDAEWVSSCRLTGFQHDRTDVRFELGGRE